MALDYTGMAKLLNAMNLGELREVHRLVVNQINALHRQRARQAAEKFKVGDLIEYVDDRRGLRVRARVERINPRTLLCQEIEGSRESLRISPVMCRLVGA